MNSQWVLPSVTCSHKGWRIPLMAIGGKGRMKGRSYRGKRACVRFCKCPHIPPPHPHPNAMFDGGSGRGGGALF